MADQHEPLLLRYPILHRLRRIDSWWALGAAFEGGPIDMADADEALQALIAVERSANDHASADTHEAFRGVLVSAGDAGTARTFEAHAARMRVMLPIEIGRALSTVDAKVLAHLTTSDPAALQAAERAWIELARAIDIDALPPPFRISLVCDAAVLHQAVFDRSPSRTGLAHLTGVLRAAWTLFSEFESHAPACCLHLDPRLQTVTAALAVALRTRYGLSQEHADLTDATTLHRHLIRLTHPAAPDLPLYLAEYGKTLGYHGTRGIRAGALVLSEAAALELPGSAECLANMALAGKGHLAAFAVEREPAQLHAAIAALEIVVQESKGEPTRTHARLLAEALLRRAVVAGSADDARAAVHLLGGSTEEKPDAADLPTRLLDAVTPIMTAADAGDLLGAALDALRTVASPEQAEAVAAHAAELVRLLDAYAAGRDIPHVLDRMVRLLETAQALDSTSAAAADRSTNLAVLLGRRFAGRGDTQDLGNAVQAARHALDMSPGDDTARRRDYANTLGALLVRRYDVAGALTDLEEAIAALSFAVPDAAGERASLDAERLAGYMGNLGSALRQRSERRRAPADLDRAIDLLEDAVAIAFRADQASMAQALNNLAAAFHDRWRRRGRGDDLDAAIARWTEAEALSDGAVVRMNRGSAILSRYERDGAPADLDEAIRLLEAAVPALEPYSPDRALAANRLAAGFHLRGSHHGHASELQAARDWSRHAVAWAADTSVETRFRVAWDWGSRAAESAAWDDASEAYGVALAAVRMLFDGSLSMRDRESLLEQAFGLPTRAAYAMARAGRLRDAAVALEYGRGLLLADRLGIVESRLDARAGAEHADVLAQYGSALGRWRALADRMDADASTTDRITWADVETTRGALLESRHRIESTPGLEDAFGPPAFDEIAAAATTPLVYFVPGRDAGAAIVVRAGTADPVLVALPGLGEASVGRETRAFVAAYESILDDPEAWPPALDRLTRWLGDALVPAIGGLHAARAVFIPTGALAFLPLHAAWTDDPGLPTGRRYALDEVSVSYAPSALSLAAARRRPSAGASVWSLLGVSNPQPSSQAPLAYAGAEVAMAAAHFPTTQRLEGQAATADAGRSLLGAHHVAHYACHARSVLDDPRRSGILHAHDRMLTVADLVDLDLGDARLAVLSACETGIPGAEAPDEVIGIGTALFGAGFDGVVASLWPVLDVSTLLVMTRFYEYWRGSEDEGHDPAEALVLAQRWVRDTTNEEKRRHWDALSARGALPDETHKAVTRELRARPAGTRSFASPDDWAPFTFIGIW